METLPPNDIAQINTKSHFKQFPIFLIAITLMWVGALAYADYFLTRIPSLLSLGCAAVFFLCGAALLTAQSRPGVSSALATAALALIAYSLVHNLAQALALGPDRAGPFGLHLEIDGPWAVLSGILSIAIICSRRGAASRRLARCLGFIVIVGAVSLRLAPGRLALSAYSTPDMANLAALLGIMAGYAVVALSRRWKAESAFADRTIAAMGIMGALVSVLAWYAMTEQDRSWLEPLAKFLPDLVLLVCLTFTFFLTRSQKLATILHYRSIQLHYGSLHDYLTELPNRKYLEAKLKEACRLTRHCGGKLWVVVFDLDGMKLINDSMGRDVGDEVLKKVAVRIVQGVEGKQFVARMEGAEFVVLFTNADNDAMLETTNRIIAALAKPYCVENMELRLTASAGITVSNGHVDR
ncbi:MAG: diguanylate cyclase domain-containing protein, partial [Pollutimonas bauzanensis]